VAENKCVANDATCGGACPTELQKCGNRCIAKTECCDPANTRYCAQTQACVAKDAPCGQTCIATLQYCNGACIPLDQKCCVQGGDATCGECKKCNDKKVCVAAPEKTCGAAAACANGTETGAKQCTAQGTCPAGNPPTKQCGPSKVCVGTACGNCDRTHPCPQGKGCMAGSCVDACGGANQPCCVAGSPAGLCPKAAAGQRLRCMDDSMTCVVCDDSPTTPAPACQ
jgi:hypothetical protein